MQAKFSKNSEPTNGRTYVQLMSPLPYVITYAFDNQGRRLERGVKTPCIISAFIIELTRSFSKKVNIIHTIKNRHNNYKLLYM